MYCIFSSLFIRVGFKKLSNFHLFFLRKIRILTSQPPPNYCINTVWIIVHNLHPEENKHQSFCMIQGNIRGLKVSSGGRLL